jgi:hypothetical protein
MPGIDADSTLERAGQRLASLSSIRGLWATVAGIALVVIAFASAQGGAWFVPLLVIGLVLIAAGILGPRIRGRVSLEFGMGGATLDVQLHIAPPGQVGRLPRRGAAAAAVVAAPEAAVPGAEAQTSDAPTVIAEAVPAGEASPVALPDADADAVDPPVAAAAHPMGNGHHPDPAQAALRAARAAEAVAAVVAANRPSNGNGNGHAPVGVEPEPGADQPAAEPDRS